MAKKERQNTVGFEDSSFTVMVDPSFVLWAEPQEDNEELASNGMKLIHSGEQDSASALDKVTSSCE